MEEERRKKKWSKQTEEEDGAHIGEGVEAAEHKEEKPLVGLYLLLICYLLSLAYRVFDVIEITIDRF